MDYDIARVTWEDSCEPTPNSEVEPNEIPEPLLIEQAGWIVEDNENYVTVAGAIKPNHGTFDYVISIPRSAIREYKVLLKTTAEERTEGCSHSGMSKTPEP
jgi:hypothetical protein